MKRVRFSILVVATLAAVLFGTARSANAQFCFELFEGGGGFTLLQCAEAGYTTANEDFSEFDENISGSSGPTGAEFDGLDLFDDPDIDIPANLGEPFFARTTLIAPGGLPSTPSFTTEHRGNVTMSPRDVPFQSAHFETRSVITFVPISLDGSKSPGELIDFTLGFEADFSLGDNPAGSGSTGASIIGAGIDISTPGFETPIFEFDGGASLDFDLDDDVDLFGDFDGADVAIDPEDPNSFDIVLDLDIGLDGAIGEPLEIETDTFGSIFSDGFESGDVSAWTASSPDTFRFIISSPDPTVGFMIVPEPSVSLLVLAGLGGVLVRRRR